MLLFVLAREMFGVRWYRSNVVSRVLAKEFAGPMLGSIRFAGWDRCSLIVIVIVIHVTVTFQHDVSV